MRHAHIIALLLGLLVPQQGIAATFTAVPAQYSSPETGLIIRGEIAEGDAKRFLLALEDARVRFSDHRLRIVSLDSPGGLVSEALQIARIVYDRGLVTIVETNSICVSACVLIFSSGSKKYFGSSSRIGVHGASDSDGKQGADALAATAGLAKIYAALGAPDSVVAKMVVTEPERVAWLSPRDILLFPGAAEAEANDEDFPAVGAGLDGLTRVAPEVNQGSTTYRLGFKYGYDHPSKCGLASIAIAIPAAQNPDLYAGCIAGEEALRQANRSAQPLPAKSLTTTFGPPPKHDELLVQRASQFLNAYKEGYFRKNPASCKQFGSLSDVCDAAVRRRLKADSGKEDMLTAQQIEKDFGPQEWLEGYDWAYTNHNAGFCGVMRAPSVLGCEAGSNDWPRTEKK